MDDDRLKPCMLWHYIVGPYVSPLKISPSYLTTVILNGRSTPQLIDSYLAVIEVAKIINRMLGRAEFHGVLQVRRKCVTKRK